jgi:singapore isolate B (sub-type 7) whole genome shotgun sequence assembly, scaffold_7|nr:MAG TPA: protein of unknown function (DUF883) [Caudoviricetes sp.]
MILVLINAYGLEGTKLHLTVGKKRQVILQDDNTFIKIVSQVVRFDEEVGDLYFKLKSKAWPLLISLYHRGLVKFLTHDYNEIPAKFLVSYSTIKSYDRETNEPELAILDRKRNIVNPKVKHVRGNPLEQMKNFKQQFQQEDKTMENTQNNQTQDQQPANFQEWAHEFKNRASKLTEEQIQEIKAKAEEAIKASEAAAKEKEEAEKLASEAEAQMKAAKEAVQETAKPEAEKEAGLSTSTKVLLGAIGLGAVTAAGWFLGKRIGLFGDASTVIETIDETVNN